MLAFKCPRIRNDRHPRCTIKFHTVDLSPAITKKMNVLGKPISPINAMILKKNMRNREEIMVPGSNGKLNIRI